MAFQNIAPFFKVSLDSTLFLYLFVTLSSQPLGFTIQYLKVIKKFRFKCLFIGIKF